MRVLLVDDDPFQLMVVSNLFSKAGHAVSTADSGATCLERLAEGNFLADPVELMLLDFELGDTTAVGVVQTLRAGHPWLAGVQVIVMSGHSDDHLQLELRGLGVEAFWSKPVTIDRIGALGP